MFILFILLISCGSDKKTERETKDSVRATPIAFAEKLKGGEVYERTSPGGSSYSLYIPENFSGNEKFPVMIFLDPHGKGNFPVSNYKNMADKFGVMLIGSNDSKNGMDFQQCMRYVADLLNESQANLPGKGNVTLAGFSGGAKVALLGGNSIPGIRSIVYCGAAFQPGNIEIKIPSLGIAGQRDMNYTEVKNFDASIKNLKHACVEWKGKHEWPDSSTFVHAFYWNYFTGAKPGDSVSKTAENFKSLIESKISQEKKMISRAQWILEEINVLSDLYPVDDSKKKLTAIINSSSYKEERSREEKIILSEDNKKQELAGAFESKDINWWKNKTHELANDKNNESSQRLLAYISLASWSFSSKAIAANDAGFAHKALLIYKLADPENSEQPYLQARLCARNGNPDSAMYFIHESVKLGLDDRQKLETENDLANLHSRSDYQDVIAKMK